jgi:AraC-like DNA-binding protein
MLSIPRDLISSAEVPNVAADGIILAQFQRRQSDFKHEMCVSKHSLVFILEGEKCIHTNDTDLLVRAGEAFFTRKGCHLMSEMIPENGGAFQNMLFFFEDAVLSEFLGSRSAVRTEGRNNLPVFKVAVSEQISTFITSVANLLGTSLGGDKDFLKLKSFELLHYVCADSRNSEFLNFLHFCRYEDDISAVVEKYFNKNISINDMAELSGRSLSTFKREFNRIFGKPPAKWIRERRISWAAQLLRNSAKSITEISYESGYDSQSHFSAVFRKFYGVSPKEFRLEPKSAEIEL